MNIKLLSGFILGLAAFYQAKAAYVPVTIASGFNADVIANGTGSALTTTTSDVDGVNYCYFSNGWQLNSTSTPATTGLPATGLINSNVTAGLSFQLASYSANNDLRLATNGASGTLAFQTPVAAQNLYLLAVTGSGSSTITVQINFTDATSQTSSTITVADWYGGTSVAITGFQRMNRNTNAVDNGVNGPNIYQYTIPITAANQTKQIASIVVTRNTATGTDTKTNIFAVSIETSNVVTCAAPTAPTATAITTTTASLNWTQTGTPPQWQIKYGPTGFNVNTGGTSIFTATKPYTLNPPLTASTTYDYYVRAVCGANDTSAWTPVTTFTTACVGETISSTKDSFVCVSGVATLEAAATGSGSVKWYAAATGGTALFTGNAYTTPNITTSTTYYVSAASGTCESSPRIAVQAVVRPRPIVNLGNDTTVCPGASHTLNATVTGATYSWNYNGATTPTITTNQAGMYTVLVTVNKCSNRDTIYISPGIVPVNVMPAAIDLCDGFTTTLNAGNAGSSYLWSPGGQTSALKTVGVGGTQSVTITSPDGCVIVSSSNITMRPNPLPALIADTSICEQSVITLDAGNSGYTYLWSTNDVTQTIQVADSGTYSVLVTSPYGCEMEEEVHVAYLPSPRVQGFNFIPFFNNQLGRVKFIPLYATDVTRVHWSFGDGDTSVAMSPEHLYTAAGDYEVVLTVFNDCSNYSVRQVINVELSGTVGIDAPTLAQQFTLYPNPAVNTLTIKAFSQDVVAERILVMNALGAKIMDVPANGNQQHVLDLSALSSGLYYVQINTNKGTLTKKVEVIR